MTAITYLNILNALAKAGHPVEGLVCHQEKKPWGIRWTNVSIDSHAEEDDPVTFYYTPAEAIRAAISTFDPYDPSLYPQTTEPVEAVKVTAKALPGVFTPPERALYWRTIDNVIVQAECSQEDVENAIFEQTNVNDFDEDRPPIGLIELNVAGLVGYLPYTN